MGLGIQLPAPDGAWLTLALSVKNRGVTLDASLSVEIQIWYFTLFVISVMVVPIGYDGARKNWNSQKVLNLNTI